MFRFIRMTLLSSVIISTSFGCANQAVVEAPVIKSSPTAIQEVERKPIWVNQESVQYPGKKYLTGLGSGSSLKSAEDAARAAIAKIFSSEIQATTSTSRQYQKRNFGVVNNERFNVRSSSAVTVSTRKVLQNLKIVERWYDKQQQRHVVLAAMDREHSEALLRAQITQVDRDIQALRQRGVTIADQIDAMRNLHRTMDLLLKRTIYNADLRIVNSNAIGMTSSVSLADLKLEIQHQLLNNFQIGVKVVGKFNEKIRSGIIEILTKEGFSVSNSHQVEKLDMLVEANVAFEKSDLPKYKIVRWQLTLNLKNTKTKKILGEFERGGKEAHKTYKEAEKRALRSLNKAIETKIGTELISLILSGKK